MEVEVVMVGHIWNVCKVSGIRAMPSHVNNQKLQPRFQRVSGYTAHVCRIYVYTADRSAGLYIAGLYMRNVRVRATRVCTTRERIPDHRSFIAPRCAASRYRSSCTA